MNIHPIVFAVPVYALLIGLELFLLRRQGSGAYDIPELLANVGSGLGQLVTDIFIGLLYQVPYGKLHHHFALFTFTVHDALAWVIAFVGVDFAFYWQHRISHGVNVFWATHVVHHQPERYNLGVALRTPWFSGLTNWVYYLPLAVLGIPVDVFVRCIALNLAYQFYLHTNVIGKMSWVEGILNTPSHHRVHHGRNPEYLDRNFAGVFIVWDRLFGTFQAEDAPAEFGTTIPYRSMNGVWANFDYPWHLWLRSRQQKRLRDALYVWLAPPGWQAKGEVALDPPSTLRHQQTRGAVIYAAMSSLIAVVASALLITRQDRLLPLQRVIGVGLIVWALASIGSLLDGRGWAKRYELVRVAVLVGFAWWFWKSGRFI
jgi:alkylglycerol monooxygenase